MYINNNLIFYNQEKLNLKPKPSQNGFSPSTSGRIQMDTRG